MNEWDNLDNFPEDDDEPDFSWLDEDNEDLDWLNSEAEESPEEETDSPKEWQMPRPAKAERDIAAQMEEAEAADFGDADEMLDWMSESDEDSIQAASDVPDWLADMDLPEVSEEELAAAQASVSSDEEDDFDSAWASEFGDESEEQEEAVSGWGFEEDDSESSEEEEGVSADSILFASSSEDDEADSFLFGATSADDEEDSFLFGATASDDKADSFLMGVGGEEDNSDSFLFGTGGEEDEEDFLFGESEASPSSSSSDEWGSVGASWTGEMPAVPDDAEEAMPEGWGEIEFDETDPAFANLFGAEESSPAEASSVPEWLVGDDEEDLPAASTESPADIGVPDWLMGLDDEEEASAPMPEVPAYDSEEEELDFLADLGEPVAEEDDLLGDLFADDEEDDLLGDLLADVEGDEDDDLGELLAGLELEEDANVDDLLAALGGDDEEAEELDLSALLGESEAELPDPADDLDFLLEEEEEETAPVNDLDFLEPVADSEQDLDFLEPVTASSSDLDFLDSVEDSADDLDFLEPVADTTSELDFLDESDSSLDFLEDAEDMQDIASDLDFLATMGEEDEEETGFYQEDSAADLDFFDQEENEESDWFEEAAPADSLDFLDDLPDEYPQEEAAEEGDWLSALDDIDEATLAASAQKPQSAKAAGLDIDALISSFGDDEEEDEDEEELPLAAADLDSIFGDFDKEQREIAAGALPDDVIPDWLRDVVDDVDENSAAAIIRQRRDRSLDDMDEKLLALRASSLELGSSEQGEKEDAGRLSKLVPNLEQGLAPVRVQTRVEALVTEPNFTAEQRQRAELLSSLMETEAEGQRRNRLGFVQNLPISRWVVSFLLLAAILAPFSIGGFGDIGILPAGNFETESPEFAAFALVEALEPEEHVLVAVEYGATGARELDTATRALFEHIIVNGAKPVVVSSDAVGLIRADGLLVNLAGEERRNQAYYMAGFLPGGTLGLRDFALNVNQTVSYDTTGRATGLNLNSLNDFQVIILIAQNGETVRNWMEQIAPQTQTRIIVITSQAARPFAVPYVESAPNTVALLTGYEDAFTYQQMLLGEYNPSPTATNTATATNTPTNTATATNTATNTHTPSITPTATDTLTPSETPLVSDTPTPTDTATPTDTHTPTVTLTPSITPTPTDIPVIQVGTVIASGAVNVRAGAGTNFNVITGVDPGTRVRVIGISADEQWVQIVLPDGTEAWIAANLLEIEEILETEWDGASIKDSTPVLYRGNHDEVSQDATELPDDTVLVGRNVGGIRIDVFADENRVNILGQLAPNEEFIVLEEGSPLTRIIFGQAEGLVETRLIRIEARPRSEVEFAPTFTPTSLPPTATLTPSITPTPTSTQTPSPTPFMPVLTPAPLEHTELRSASQAVGLMAAIIIIAIGSIISIYRWLRQRES